MGTEETSTQPPLSEAPNPAGSTDSDGPASAEAETAGSGDGDAHLEPPPPVDQRIEVFNKTPRRIAIKPKGENTRQEDFLVISPFSSKVLSENAAVNYDIENWKQECLVDVVPLDSPTEYDLTASDYGIGCGFMLFIYLVIGMLVPFLRGSSYTWIIFGILLLVALSLVVYTAGGFKNLRGNLERLGRAVLQTINLTLFLVVVFGLGVSLFYLFSGGRELTATGEFTIEGLARVIQYMFLTIATLLPALMYFLFNRRQRKEVQENFIREVLRMDPGIRTITEAESKYLSHVQETFGTSYTSAFLFSSGLPILLCTLLMFMGWLMILQPFVASAPVNVQQLETLLLPRANAVTFAFLGAYFFAVNLVFRRYVRADLTPKTYTHIITRLLLAIILAWTLSALPMFNSDDASTNVAGTVLQMVSPDDEAVQPEATTETDSTEAAAPNAGGFSTGLLYLLAFFIGIFPETGVTVLRDLARNPLFTRMFPRLEEDHPLTRLDGINLYDRSRFMEEGIENIENLAHHNLIGLMLSTRISTNRLVDMFDQAILYLHLGLEPKDVTDTRKTMRKYGIRTATDLEAAYESAQQRGTEEFGKFLMILDEESGESAPLSRLQTILDTLRDDDWMTYLRNWRELSQHSAQIFTLKGVALVPLEDDEQRIIARAY
jgi:hypothetical protein